MAAAEDLPSEFDVVILGTGLTESVAAAAFSRVGQKVLHLDRNSHYASQWASFTFNGLLTWIQEQQAPPQPTEASDWSALCEKEEELIYLSDTHKTISNIQVFCYASEEDEEEEEEAAPKETTEEEITTTETAGQTDGENTTDKKSVEEEEEEEGGGGGEGGEEEDKKESQDPDEPKKEPEKEEEEGEDKKPVESEEAGLVAESQSEPQKKKKISYKKLVKEGRRFNIDLVSKLLFARGSLVDLLIKSNVSRYAEFKNVTRILTYRKDRVEQVPCSRADVFASKQLSVVEKRKLMKFLTSCLETEETDGQRAYNGRPYLEFLRSQQLGQNLEHFLVHSISMATEATPTEVALGNTRHFLSSLGRYGNTPFLFPVYGLGEIPQCFCRMCAVFGGIYCLRHSVSALLLDKETKRCKAVIDSKGQRISCSHFIVEEGYMRQAPPTRFISRAVLITDRSILPTNSPDQQVSVVTIPPIAEGSPSVKMVELCPSTMTCMAGTYLVHLSCQSIGSAFEDLSPLVTKMFQTDESHDQDERPCVLWSFYFNMADGSSSSSSSSSSPSSSSSSSLVEKEVENNNKLPSNVYLCSGPDAELGHDHAITQAESIFQRILPEEDFCPPAPNPEDIIYDGDTNTDTHTDGNDDINDDINVEEKEEEEKVNEGMTKEEEKEEQDKQKPQVEE